MKKRFYTACAFAALALMTSASASAQAPAKTLHTIQARHAIATPRMVSHQEIEAQANEVKVPTSVSHNNGSGQTVQSKAEYDQKGRVCRITFDDGTVYQMTYTENANGEWTTKNTSVKKGEEELHKLKTERTFDDKGRVTTIEEAAYDTDSKQWAPTHSYAYDYDMSHISKDPDLASRGDALLCKDIAYKVTATGVPYREGIEYVWYEPDQEYSYFEPCLGYNTEYKLEGNTFWYSNVYYDEETGEITYARYTKEEAQEDTPQPGYYTITEYESKDNKNWEFSKKIVMTTNYYAPFTPDDRQKHERATYFYDKETQQLYMSVKVVEEWADHPTLKLVKLTSYEDSTTPESDRYQLVDEQGRTDTDSGFRLALSDNGDYSFIQGYSPLQIITFYSAQGEKKQQVRITGTNRTLAQAPCIAEELKDGEWVPLRNASLKSGDMGYRTLSFKTNEEGYITSQTTCYSGNESFSECTYSDMGYTSEQYYKYKGDEQKYLTQRDVCTKTSEDAFEIISTKYKDDGTIVSNYRKVCRDGVTYTYPWDDETNQWSDQYTTSVAPITTMEDDGAITTIYRTYIDGEVVNSSKEVNKPYRIPRIKMNLPANPMPDVIPAELFSGIHLTTADSGTDRTSYEWNTETNQWDVFSKARYGYSETKDDITGNITHHVIDRGTKYAYCVDSEDRLVSYQDPDRSLAYSYDEDGNLTQVTESSEDGTQSYIIAYGKIGMITDGISLPTATQALQLHVDGRTITLADASSHALGGKSLQVYSLDGKLVGKSLMGSVTAPAAGTYVVVADGVKAKISVK